MTTHEITLVVPGRPLNRNDRGHWRVKAKLTNLRAALAYHDRIAGSQATT